MASVEGIRCRPTDTPATHNPSTTRSFENRFPARTARSSFLIILILIVPILIVTTLIVTTYLPETSGQFELLKKTSGPYELLRLVLVWGPSFCLVRKCKRNTTTPNFTLHGLWPDNRTLGLSNCSESPYTPLQNQSDINQRDKYWFDYNLSSTPNAGQTDEQRFWGRQWKKHGTCSEMNFRQPDYFDLAVNLTRRYYLRIKETLSGVEFPANMTKVLNAIKNVTKKLPEVRCPGCRGLLIEVVICFDPMGRALVDCPGKNSCAINSIGMPKTF